MRKIISLLLAMLITASLPFAFIACGEDEEQGADEPMGVGACEFAETRDIKDRDIYYAEICVENYGKMVILLDATTAPITVNNFMGLVKKGFYNGLTFHRIINDFMIQGGDPQGNGLGGSGQEIVGEFLANGYYNDLEHIEGVISMARGGYSYDSASSQFFICNSDARSRLDGKYAAFGYVVEGLSVVHEITNDVYPKTGSNGEVNKEDQPVIKYIKMLDGYGK